MAISNITVCDKIPKAAYSLIIGLLGLIFLACENYAVKKEYYPNGHPKKEWGVKSNENGALVKHGPLKSWYESGQLEAIIQYKNGQMDGEASIWYKNGNHQFTGKYDKGYLVAETLWDEKGKEQLSRKYRIETIYYKTSPQNNLTPLKEKYTVIMDGQQDTLRHGAYRSWYNDGKLRMITDYAEGKLNGFAKEWHSNGLIKSEGYYKNGRREGPWLYKYENGERYISLFFREDKKDGSYKLWYPSGGLKEMRNYKSDTLDGEYMAKFIDGSPKESRFYKNGLLEGTARLWYKSKGLNQETQWSNNSLNGTFKEWYANGRLKFETTYKNGKKNGISQKWYPNSAPFYEAHYLDDKMHGKFLWWTEKGKLISEREYINGTLTFDSEILKMREIMDAVNTDIPMEILGFMWGMTPIEVSANLKLFDGQLIKRKGSQYICEIPVLSGLFKDVQVTFTFNNWNELWEIGMEFPKQTRKQFYNISDFIEDKMGYKLGMPEFNNSLKSLPGILQRTRDWGSFYLTGNSGTQKVREYPVIHAELFAFEDKEWISFLLQNHLIHHYARKSPGIVLQGPYYKDESNN